MKTKIYIPDIECESCIKVLEKRFAKLSGIQNTHFTTDSVDISYDENKIQIPQILKAIKDAGYRAAEHPFERKTLRERGREFREKKAKYELEHKLIPYTALIFFSLMLIQVLAYLFYFKNYPDIQQYLWWFFYLDISLATLAVALWHYLSYKAKTTCMLGMMIGMTLGMQTGMMLGAIIGATNGLFLGAVIGVILGVTVGIYTGKCCGIMGTMQGMMAGLMGGIMGPMTTLMLYSDHLLWFMPLYMVINILIVWGFSYMLYEEMVEEKEVKKQPVSFTKLLIYTNICMIILALCILYGIRSPLLGGGL
jgi:copper chaperone CopZ